MIRSASDYSHGTFIEVLIVSVPFTDSVDSYTCSKVHKILSQYKEGLAYTYE